MVALAPITNETPTWDVLDAFPKLHSRAREAKTPRCTEVPMLKSRSRIEIWLTNYETCDRLESFTRDPIGFRARSANIYQYISGRVLIALDPSGLQISGGERGPCGSVGELVFGPKNGDICDNDVCCLESEVGWKYFGFINQNDCESDCNAQYGAWYAAAGSIPLGVCSGAPNPLVAKACTIGGVAVGSYAFGIIYGCKLACGGDQCTKTAAPTPHTVNVKSWFCKKWDYDYTWYSCPKTKRNGVTYVNLWPFCGKTCDPFGPGYTE
jgi:hypothetical protein